MDGRRPDVSVVVPSHGRLLRARWLLNALEEQTLDRARFEVVLVHDYPAGQAAAMLDGHPLASAGVLRTVPVAPEQARASRQRNLGWRAARAALVAFTDDDCRPEPDWLERLLEAAERAPGAIVQGAVRSDPLEHEVFAGPLSRSLDVDPPDPRAHTANILYPRAVLERAGGFAEELRVGEDMDLCLRAVRAGARHAGAPDAIVNHAVTAYSLRDWYRANRKWRHLPLMTRREPALRRHNTLGVFWNPRHARALLAFGALAVGVVRPRAALLALPYLAVDALGQRGPGWQARAVAAVELPRTVAADLIEAGVFVAGSVQHRSLFL